MDEHDWRTLARDLVGEVAGSVLGASPHGIELRGSCLPVHRSKYVGVNDNLRVEVMKRARNGPFPETRVTLRSAGDGADRSATRVDSTFGVVSGLRPLK
jgi:hypothetical protein